MTTLKIIGFCSLLSMLTIGWIPAAWSEALAPQASRTARDLSEYVYLHVTRNQGTSKQDGTRASTCRGTSRGVQS